MQQFLSQARDVCGHLVGQDGILWGVQYIYVCNQQDRVHILCSTVRSKADAQCWPSSILQLELAMIWNFDQTDASVVAKIMMMNLPTQPYFEIVGLNFEARGPKGRT